MNKILTSFVACLIFAISLTFSGVAQAGWTDLGVPPELQESVSSARACKTYVESPLYGGLWKLNYQVFRKNTNAEYISVRVYRYEGQTLVARSINSDWLYGVVSGIDNVYASVYWNDRVLFGVGYFANGNYDEAYIERDGPLAIC
jgi:hypothetical protein